jgi:hypothetical protein
MTEQELKKWAIEQAIKLHAANGISTAKIIEAADAIIAYVKKA